MVFGCWARNFLLEMGPFKERDKGDFSGRVSGKRHLNFTFRTHFWGDQTMQMYGNFGGFPYNSALFAWVCNIMTPVNDDFTKIIQSFDLGALKVYEDLNLSLLRHEKIWQRKQHIFSHGSLSSNSLVWWKFDSKPCNFEFQDWPIDPESSESTSPCGIYQSIHVFSKSPNHNTHHRLSVLTFDGLNLTWYILPMHLFHLTGNYPASWLVKRCGALTACGPILSSPRSEVGSTPTASCIIGF